MSEMAVHLLVADHHLIGTAFGGEIILEFSTDASVEGLL